MPSKEAKEGTQMKQATQDLLDLVIKPTLYDLGMDSEKAEALLLGTALVESGGHAIRQHGGGPALGLFQMEPTTHDDIWENFIRYRPNLYTKIKAAAHYGGAMPPVPDVMSWNARYACAMARIHYLRVPEPLPASVEGMAAYYKKFYNTTAGKGTVERFLEAWNNA